MISFPHWFRRKFTSTKPIKPAVIANCQARPIPTGTIFKGCEIQMTDQVKIGKGVVFYELDDFVETSFRLLDRQLTHDAVTRVS